MLERRIFGGSSTPSRVLQFIVSATPRIPVIIDGSDTCFQLGLGRLGLSCSTGLKKQDTYEFHSCSPFLYESEKNPVNSDSCLDFDLVLYSIRF